jgi:hypothetical protein
LLRALCVAVATIVVCGCVSITGPSPTPSVGGPSLGVATPQPEVTSNPVASAVPSSQPSTPVAASASPIAPTVPPSTPPATPATTDGDLLFFDDMDDPSSGWSVGEVGNSSVFFADEGRLRLQVGDAGQAIWSPRRLDGEFGVLLVAGGYVISGDGGIGAACVTEDNQLYGAEVTTTGELIFFSIVDGITRALDTKDFDELTQGVDWGLGIECTGLSTGALRLVAVMPGQGALGVYQDSEGPNAFVGVGMYGEAIDGPATVDVREAAAYGIPGSADQPSADGQELMTHVPPDWQQTCVDTPSSNAATAVVSCFLQTEGTGAELAIFQQFASATAMDDTYRDLVDVFGVEPEGDCEQGPNETTWIIEEAIGGRLQCAPQGVGIRFDWTNDELLILSSLFDLEGDYQNTYRLWLDAGPF